MSIFDITFKTQIQAISTSNVSKFNVNKGLPATKPSINNTHIISLPSNLLSGDKTAKPLKDLNLPRYSYNFGSVVLSNDVKTVFPAQKIQPNQAFVALGAIPQPDPNEPVVVINAQTATIADKRIRWEVLPCFLSTIKEENERAKQMGQTIVSIHLSDFGPLEGLAVLVGDNNIDFKEASDKISSLFLGATHPVNSDFEDPCDAYRGTCCINYGIINEQNAPEYLINQCYKSERFSCVADEVFYSDNNFQISSANFYPFITDNTSLDVVSTDANCSLCDVFYVVTCYGNDLLIVTANEAEAEDCLATFATTAEAQAYIDNIKDQIIYTIVYDDNNNCSCLEVNYWCLESMKRDIGFSGGEEIFNTREKCEQYCDSTTTTTTTIAPTTTTTGAPTSTTTTTIAPTSTTSTTSSPDNGDGESQTLEHRSSYLYNQKTKKWEKQ